MGTPSTEDLLETFRQMTLLQLAEFTAAFEDAFGVTAAAPPAVVSTSPAAEAQDAEPEKDDFDVLLRDVGAKKIQVIKVVRQLTGLGLKEAKDLVEAAPKPILEKADKAAAEKAVALLRAEGADVTLS